MTQVIRLSIDKRYRAYNERLLKAFKEAGIAYQFASSGWGKRVMVKKSQSELAYKIILSTRLK